MYRAHLVVRGYRGWLVPLVSREHQAGQDLVDLQEKMEMKDPQVMWLVQPEWTIPYSWKYWRSLNLAVWPKTKHKKILTEFQFGGGTLQYITSS